MYNYNNYLILFIYFLVFVITGCTSKQTDTAPQPENTFTINGNIREMKLYPEPPGAFPEQEGKKEFMTNCAICHSLKYISMQPDFSAKTWDAEVTKMIAKYHAPVDSVTAKKIVGYLVAIKGKK